jgi:hypothetical protein
MKGKKQEPSIGQRPHLDYVVHQPDGPTLERYTFHPAVLPFLPKVTPASLAVLKREMKESPVRKGSTVAVRCF